MKRREALKKSGWIMGGLMGSGTLTSFLQGCKVKPDNDFTPAFLAMDEYHTISALCDVIIPAGEKWPSASSVGVPQLFDETLALFVEPEIKVLFKEKIGALNESCNEKFGKEFKKLSAEEQESVVADMVTDARESKEPGKDFFLLSRHIICSAYVRTEEVAKNVMKHVPVPGEQKGCVPLEEATGGVGYSVDSGMMVF